MPSRPADTKPVRRATAKRTGARSDTKAPMRRRRDPEGMQRKILEAATGEFADHGYGGARVERISRRARTVDRMLYYYFGNKEKLFRAVLESAYERLGGAEERLSLATTPPLEGMRQLIAFTWDYYCAHPEFIRLLNSENQHRGQHLKRSDRLNQLSFPLLSTLRDLLARGGRQGQFRTDVDPVQIYITIAALGYFYLSNRYTLSRFLDRDLMAEDNRGAWLAHITEVVMNHITTVS
jgi:TetR/AcrR family transcriptional regulator, upper aerobic nicotinate degradation pathway regulator